MQTHQLFSHPSSHSFSRNFSKAFGRWSCVPVMEAKTYPYIQTLMRAIFTKRLEDTQPMRRSLQLSTEDPRRLAPTIRPVDPPSVACLVASHESSLLVILKPQMPIQLQWYQCVGLICTIVSYRYFIYCVLYCTYLFVGCLFVGDGMEGIRQEGVELILICGERG